jgi:hypothetical protein
MILQRRSSLTGYLWKITKGADSPTSVGPQSKICVPNPVRGGVSQHEMRSGWSFCGRQPRQSDPTMQAKRGIDTTFALMVSRHQI